jgi:hypothetical protein
MTKPAAIIDAHWQRVGELFAPVDRVRLGELCQVVWGRDELMPAALPNAGLLAHRSWSPRGPW